MSSNVDPFVPVGRINWDEEAEFTPKGEIKWDKPSLDQSPMALFDEALAREEQETAFTAEETNFLEQQEGGGGVGLDLVLTIASHETKGEENPWIRTRFQPTEGSTAFGPAQITGRSLKDLRGKTSKPETLEFLIAQADKFAELGGGDWKNKGLTEEEAKAFEYGGTGFGLTDQQKEDYWVIAQELLSRKASILGLSPNPVDWTEEDKRKVVEAWHGGGEDISSEEYVNKVLGALDEDRDESNNS